MLLKEDRFRYGKISDRYTGKLFTGSPPPLDFSLYLCRKNKAEMCIRDRYIGWQGAFYNVAKIIGTGLLVYLAGFLKDEYEGPAEDAEMCIRYSSSSLEWRTMGKCRKERSPHSCYSTLWD